MQLLPTSGIRSRQAGAVTMFSAVLILVLLTAVVLYATRVGVSEQRKSGNDMRQKQAFHAAEAGIHHAREYFLAHALRVSFPGETGWLESGAERWVPCPDSPESSHPCAAESLQDVPAVYGNTYFFCQEGEDCSNATAIAQEAGPTLVPLDPTISSLDELGERVEVQALLCVLDIDRTRDPVVQGCTTSPPAGEHVYYMLTLLARGQADCSDVADPASCTAAVLVAEKIGSFGPGAGEGAPGVPLTTRSNFPPGGTAEVVPNPNGGGIGVPISAWINGRLEGSLCPSQGEPVDATGGSWATCEAHEWYGVDGMPADYACPTTQCSCDPSTERLLSYTSGGETTVGIDIVADPEFPCDLFQATFGLEATAENFWKLASSMGQVIDTCDNLGPDSAGPIWMVGDTCTINANTVIGSKDFPVFLISAASTTRLSGGAELWGVLYVSDVLRANATFESSGTNTIYGAAVVDAELGSYTGTFQIVYVDNIVGLASNAGALGKMTGGWTDFHRFWR